MAGAGGTEAALAAKTPGVEPLGRPRYPAAVPAVGAGVVAWVAGTMAALAAPSGVKPQGRPLDSAIAPAAHAQLFLCGRSQQTEKRVSLTQQTRRARLENKNRNEKKQRPTHGRKVEAVESFFP